ncbi:MAG: glycoside hydrolase family 127 protein [Thermoguttaceae bacterium]|nr:glycoside hydrolase family 127 protein [Thermoguttaceae bacterium]
MKKTLFTAFSLAVAALCAVVSFAQDAPKQAMREVPFTNVKLNDNYWAPRIEANRVVSIPHNIKWCETETGRINNFKIAGGLQEGEFSGIYFDDSDVYKIVEGFAYSLAAHPNPELKKKADEWISYFGKAQQDDGYLMCYFTIAKPNEKWTNLASMHELYCAGHMAEAAVAYDRATGDDTFLKINLKLLDLICKRYGPNEGQLKNVAGHEEIELALVKAYQLTGDRKYLDEAKFFIDTRGVAEGREKGLFGEYCQDMIPVRQQTEIVGHAVRAMYLYCGATDVAGYFQDAELMAAMRRIFTNLTRNKMYITGGIGSSRSNEGFEENFKLPNGDAYCETCAAIGMLFWSHRMNLATGEAAFADVMERSAYNGFMSGYGLNGDSYFYVNPLESRGDHHRQPFFGCACCPSNVIRALPSIPGYVYATAESEKAAKAGTGDDTVVINMFVQGKATVELGDKTVELEQQTNYPYDGKVFVKATAKMKDENAALTPYFIKTRIPEWSGLDRPADGYAVRTIEPKKTPTVFALDFPTPVVRMTANPNVQADVNRVALQRGPLVYCFEQVDNPNVKVDRIILAKDPEFKVETRKNFISDGNVNEATKGAASRTVDVITCKDVNGNKLTAIPYCVWDNRAAGRMCVWVRQAGLDSSADNFANAENWTDANGDPILYQPLDESVLTDDIPVIAGADIEFDGSNTTDQLSTLDAVNQSEKPKNSGDQGSPRATWWGHLGTQEWFEYSFAQPRKLTSTTVYWFDDDPTGRCRVPASWKFVYQEPGSDEWKEVKTSDKYSCDRDRDVVVNFEEINASKVRIVAQLQEEFSGGILRWVVK